MIFLFGLFRTLDSVYVVIAIEKAGRDQIIRVVFYQKSIAKEIVAEITEKLYGDADKTDLNQFFDKKEK
ncbi:MAG: hypothetical protein ACK5KQ_04390 [Anaerorhabdus sp.]